MGTGFLEPFVRTFLSHFLSVARAKRPGCLSLVESRKPCELVDQESLSDRACPLGWDIVIDIVTIALTSTANNAGTHKATDEQ